MKGLYTHLFNQSRVNGHIYKIDKSIKDFIAITADWAIQRFINQPLYSIDKISVILELIKIRLIKLHLKKSNKIGFQNHLKKV